MERLQKDFSFGQFSFHMHLIERFPYVFENTHTHTHTHTYTHNKERRTQARVLIGFANRLLERTQSYWFVKQST